MSTIGQGWLNQNSLRSYPFQENCTLICNEDASFKLPNYIIVDFITSIADTDLCTGIYLYRMSYAGDHLILEFYNSCDNFVASVDITLSAHSTYQSYTLIGQGQYIDVRGKVVIGDLAQLSTDVAEGTYTFTAETAMMEPCTVRPELRGVRQLTVVSAGEESEPITGHPKLIAGSNVRLTYIAAGNMIRIDAISGAGLNQECSCDNVVSPCIRTINGINAEDVTIVGDGTCVEVTTEGNVIKISDKCSQPCCGCPELEFITTNLGVLSGNLSRLESYAATLEAKLNELTSRVLTTLPA